MGFENLWEKYGKTPQKPKEESKTPVSVPTSVGQKKEFPSIEKPSSHNHTNKELFNRNDDSIGVFGEDTIGTEQPITKNRNKRKRGNGRQKQSSFSLANLPWIDIIGITITISGIIGVIINFEYVTDSLFAMMLPIINHISILVFIILAIILFIWWLRNRRRPRW